jgi:hypothetical protein
MYCLYSKSDDTFYRGLNIPLLVLQVFNVEFDYEKGEVRYDWCKSKSLDESLHYHIDDYTYDEFVSDGYRRLFKVIMRTGRYELYKLERNSV